MTNLSATTRCPDRDAWSAFYAGKVDSERLPAFAAHLNECPVCQTVLSDLAGSTVDDCDAFVAGLREGSSEVDAYEHEPQCREAVARVCAFVGGSTSGQFAAPSMPERLGEYRVLGLLGRGGMGAVYRAVHTRLGREVALKVVPPERARAAAARFPREVAAHGKLDHPNVVRATDAGEADGMVFLVMDLVDGINLDQLVRVCGSLAAADACELARQAAVGLHHLTSHGLVHRDVKPSNLMLSRRGEVKVLDMGLAASTDRTEPSLTDEAQVVGTFDYLAPEQADATRSIDARTDVYSLGCSLYFLLTGRAPYSGSSYTNPRSKILAHTAGPVPQVRDLRPEVPAELAAILARMLAKDPAERFENSAAVASALAPFCAGHDLAKLLAKAGLDPLPEAKSSPAVPAAPPTPRRSRSRWSAVAAVLAVLLIGGGLSAAVKYWLLPPAQPVAKAEPPPEVAPPPAEQKRVPKPEPKVEPKQEPAPVKSVLPLALFTFEERGSGAKDMGAKVTDLLFAKLTAKPDLMLVDRTDLKKILDEQALSLSGAVKPDEAVKVGQLTGAKLIVTGSVVHVDKKLYLTAKIISTETSRVVGGSAEGFLTDDLGALADKLADAIEDTIARQGEKLVPKPVPVTDRIAELNKRLAKLSRPTLAIQVSERQFGHPAAESAAQIELARFAVGTGFTLLEANAVDVVISGEGFSVVAGRIGGLVSARARVELKAVDRKTGKVIVVDSQTAIAVDLSEQIAGKAALQDAASRLAERVLPRLAQSASKK